MASYCTLSRRFHSVDEHWFDPPTTRRPATRFISIPLTCGACTSLQAARSYRTSHDRLQVFARHERTRVILWRLRGYADPEGELTMPDVVCSLQKWKCGYRLLIERGEDVVVDEHHTSVTVAQGKAQSVKARLVTMGWAAAPAAPE